MNRILVAEDEDAIREFVVINLKRAGYDVVATANGKQAVEAFERENGNFSAVLLDIMMPEMDGFEVCQHIREKSQSVGIIMLSAKSQEMDKVRGLMLGADDYVTKPFSPSELTARVDALCRRIGIRAAVQTTQKQEDDSDKLVSGPFKLDYKSRMLYKNSEAIELTQVEFQIMEFLIKNPNIAIKRVEILSAVWGNDYDGDEKIVDVNVRRLRVKIEDNPSDPKYIATVWGFGYKWTV